MSDAGAHLRAAANSLNGVVTEISLARDATSDDNVEEMVEKAEEVAADLQDTLSHIALDADIAETEAE